MAKKDPQDVVGRWLYRWENGNVDGYMLGDWGFDASNLIRTLGRNGFKIVRRSKARRPGRTAK